MRYLILILVLSLGMAAASWTIVYLLDEAVAMSRWLNRVLALGAYDLWVTVPAPPTVEKEISPSEPDPPAYVKEYLAINWRRLTPTAKLFRLSEFRKTEEN